MTSLMCKGVDSKLFLATSTLTRCRYSRGVLWVAFLNLRIKVLPLMANFRANSSLGMGLDATFAPHMVGFDRRMVTTP